MFENSLQDDLDRRCQGESDLIQNCVEWQELKRKTSNSLKAVGMMK